MKALQIVKYGELRDSLAFNEVSKPSIQETDVLIEVKAAAINPIDKIIVLGHLQGMLPIPLPSTTAYDVSGIVVEKGDKVKNFEIGDLVYSRVPQEQMGTIAEYVAVTSIAVSKKPGNISFEEAASLPLAGLTAMQSLEFAGIKENDKVLIHAGSGGVGSIAIQYAKAKGAYVYTTTSTSNVKWVKELGADHVIDYKTEDYKNIVKDADIVFDTLGNNYSLEALQVIRQGGKVISIAGPLDEEIAKLFGMADYKLPEELAKLISAKNAAYKYIFMQPNGAHLNEIKLLVEDEKIKPIIDKVYSFSESIDAFTHLASGRAKGKIVIKIK
ncbi:MAG: NADP-dependent oxidoreductase [Bacteroidetes bacterium]|jgi:NADPH:quinone reductase-like Zn-dependent oxidoreductase|nr:NADP-dependent oxidoreductase [Bacteroidota bacterium]MBT5528303.1 NADP-dependent oxidoreductase [Cytophagia bacterium]MBT3802431.1 NADP-dependent oxidoreductase [Bacteroidota bacterium]MBT4340166.1 NADP-dependent oxidoreductase [Bacteroidota bacterium]MBT4727554.1 NADP-dependent oxidoreductase [Bacteroidota bacterium]